MFDSFKRRISKSFSRAGEILTGVGPTPSKQFRNAILDEEEDKAIIVYFGAGDDNVNNTNNPQLLRYELHPSQPFPTKKATNNQESPILLACKSGMDKLVLRFLDFGGDPTLTYPSLQQTCLHVVCSLPNHPEKRAKIVQLLLDWRASTAPVSAGIENEYGREEKVSVNHIDTDGNSAIHYAAYNGLINCVEKLTGAGAILSIVNKINLTCCELADQQNHKDLALMLELALIYAAEDPILVQEWYRDFPQTRRNDQNVMYIENKSFTSQGFLVYVDQLIAVLSPYLITIPEGNRVCTAEVLLNKYQWNVGKALVGYNESIHNELLLQPLDIAQQGKKKPEKKADSTAVHNESNTMEDELGLDTIDFTIEESVQTTHPTASSVSPSAVISSSSIPVDAMCMICGENMTPGQSLAFYQSKIPIKSTANSDYPLPDEYDTHAITCNSQHSFCGSCWKAHLHVQVVENGLGYLPCLGYKCTEMLSPEWHTILVKQPYQERFRQQRIRYIVDNAGCKTCPIDGCGLLLCQPIDTTLCSTISTANSVADYSKSTPQHDGKRGSSEAQSTPASTNSRTSHQGGTPATPATTETVVLAKAGICANGHPVCFTCMQVAHSPCSCAQFPQWQQLVQEEVSKSNIKGAKSSADGATAGDVNEIANALWVAANTKRCPRCGTAIEKDEGCNHMSCRKCRKEFCWICMQDWSLHSDNTGGYFQCNRFLDPNTTTNNNDNNNNDEDMLDSEGLWAEERGNAHAETMRLRERNRKMARFIHYFTRYSAHGESVKMETRMSFDTMKRLLGGLSATRKGKLIWLQQQFCAIPAANTTLLSSSGVPELLNGHILNENYLEPSGLKGEDEDLNIEDLLATMDLDEDVREEILREHAQALKDKATKEKAAIITSPPKGSTETLSEEARVLLQRLQTLQRQVFTAQQLAVTECNVYHHQVENLQQQQQYAKMEECIRFVLDGFDELLRCRYFLQWSYPFAYYEFQESDDQDYTAASRRQNYHSYNENTRRQTFETLQGELEKFVETLSDVVARRRLRASQLTIMQATTLAKQKRQEFEAHVFSLLHSKQVSLRSYALASSNTRSNTSRSTASRHHSGSGSGVRHRSTRQREREREQSRREYLNTRSLLFHENQDGEYNRWEYQGGDNSDEDDDDTDLWLSFSLPPSTGSPRRPGDVQLRQHTANIRPRSTSSQSRNRHISSAANNSPRPLSLPNAEERERRVPRSASQQLGEVEEETLEGVGRGEDDDDVEATRLFLADQGLGGTMMEEAVLQLATQLRNSTPPPSTTTNTTTNSGTVNSSPPPTTRAAEPNTIGGGWIEEQESQSRRSNGVTPAPSSASRSTTRSSTSRSANPPTTTDELFSSMNDRQLAHLTRRAEEETDLNRAILMSLQDSYPVAAPENVPEINITTNNSSSSTTVSAEDLAMLMAMGFPEAECRHALSATNQNVEMAVNRLLGL